MNNADEWFTITSALTEVFDEDYLAIVVNIDPNNKRRKMYA